MNAKLLPEKELLEHVRKSFITLYPERSCEGLNQSTAHCPIPRATDHQKKGWILEMGKMALLAEDRIQPASDSHALQETISQIDNLIASLEKEYSDDEFFQAVHDKYGARGVRQAKKELAKLDAHPDERETLQDSIMIRHLNTELWMEVKEEAVEKYTPRKYCNSRSPSFLTM